MSPATNLCGRAARRLWCAVLAATVAVSGCESVGVDPAASAYLGTLALMNRSGAGVPVPAPTVQVAPVAAPW
ncbi:MAG TPA: hypothetical protein VET66_08810 [Steroidobacteraceae bacterium]|nr:hypothetical protein [Steroidobacteraceae bacterium]